MAWRARLNLQGAAAELAFAGGPKLLSSQDHADRRLAKGRPLVRADG
jgi:hypothetical protein